VIEVEHFGPVLRIRMARSVLGRGIYHTAAYRVGSMLIEYLEELGEQVRRLRASGRSVRRIQQELLGPETWISRITQGDFNGENLVRSYLERDPQPLAA